MRAGNRPSAGESVYFNIFTPGQMGNTRGKRVSLGLPVTLITIKGQANLNAGCPLNFMWGSDHAHHMGSLPALWGGQLYSPGA